MPQKRIPRCLIGRVPSPSPRLRVSVASSAEFRSRRPSLASKHPHLCLSVDLDDVFLELQRRAFSRPHYFKLKLILGANSWLIL
ncbi:hypothetical protein WN48_01305 [Eufriesea mexicana]|uniref:Uncharacterized protein n=1 Tax=Eufriesea mexicana TaxID=516756 RepID=A0A310SFZ8_9HYME|nr:hypothetical protein WN48_01305 [Eufriesea mexicana]